MARTDHDPRLSGRQELGTRDSVFETKKNKVNPGPGSPSVLLVVAYFHGDTCGQSDIGWWLDIYLTSHSLPLSASSSVLTYLSPTSSGFGVTKSSRGCVWSASILDYSEY